MTGTPAESAFRHTIRGYSYDDVQVTAQIVTGAGAPTSIGVTASCIDASNHLLVKLSASGLQIQKKDGGAYTTLQTNATPVIAASTTYWIRIRIEGNVVIGELWTGSVPPGPLSATQWAVRYVLTGANATKFGTGAGGSTGVRMESASPTALVQYFEALPYTFRGVRLPEILDLRGVPGSGPPLFDAQITTAAPATPVIASGTPSGSGGAFPSTGNYRYKVTALGAFGETLPSNEVTVAVAATTQIVTLVINPLAGASGYNVYRTVSAGAINTELLLAASTNVAPIVASDGTVSIIDVGPAAGTAIGAPAAASVLSPQWGVLSWTSKARAWNRVWNGDFELDAGGWLATASVFHAAATSMTRVTTKPDSGLGHGSVLLPAVTNTGAHFTIARRFKAGVTYTYTARVASPALTDSVTVELGARIPGTVSNDVGTASASVAVNYATYTGTWTPLNDYDSADLTVVHNTATAGTLYIDAVQVYETANSAPTLPTQAFGKGATPPFGLLDPAASIPADLAGGAIAGVAGGWNLSPSGSRFNATVPGAGAGTSVIDWWIDPSLYATPDDFARGTIALEVFWHGIASVQNPRVVLSALPDPSQSLGQERFTAEYGNVGRSLTAAISQPRLSRVGTLIMPINP
ncbi:MAG: hypothetical protein WBP81_13135, partial [Solirubrobacteraceae bacterium]